MKPPLLASSLVMMLLGSTSQAWSSDGILMNTQFPPRSNGSSILPLGDSQQVDRIRSAHIPHVYPFSTATPRWRELTSNADRDRAERLVATTTWLNGRLGTEAEVASGPHAVSWPTLSSVGHTQTDASARMFRIGLTGSEGSLRYGVTFRHAGQAFFPAPDRASREIWTEWKTGWMTFRNAVGHTWNNVEGEVTRSRMEHTYGRVGLSLSKPLWPELSVTYSRNSLNSALEPIGVAPQRSSNHTIEGAVTLQQSGWDIRFASSYIFASDLLRADAESNIRAQALSAIFRPTKTLTITPVVAYRQEFQSWSGVRIDNPTASLALSYQQSPQLLVSTVGNYSSSSSADGLIQTDHLKWKGTLDWAVHSSTDWVTKVGVEAGYNRVTNRVSRSANTEDISGLVRLGIVAR